ncbi:MAG: hypothetical protein GX335_07270 [Firmicutes bacterium]|nr:hypothetical protein [Bacillota bacterium]
MKKRHLALKARIRTELEEMELTVGRIEKGWTFAKDTGDDFYLDSVALNLHSFYTAIEKTFELIAAEIDEAKLFGENWHQELLKQMASEIELVRPAVISKELRNVLDEYGGFRHVVRNVYSFNLSAERIGPLVQRLRETFTTLVAEMGEFLMFLSS